MSTDSATQQKNCLGFCLHTNITVSLFVFLAKSPQEDAWWPGSSSRAVKRPLASKSILTFRVRKCKGSKFEVMWSVACSSAPLSWGGGGGAACHCVYSWCKLMQPSFKTKQPKKRKKKDAHRISVHYEWQYTLNVWWRVTPGFHKPDLIIDGTVG